MRTAECFFNAMIADENGKLRVSAPVGFQSARFTKPLLANIALKRFLSSVDAHVVLQNSRLTKTLLANIALKRFLARVDALVVLQSSR